MNKPVAERAEIPSYQGIKNREAGNFMDGVYELDVRVEFTCSRQPMKSTDE